MKINPYEKNNNEFLSIPDFIKTYGNSESSVNKVLCECNVSNSEDTFIFLITNKCLIFIGSTSGGEQFVPFVSWTNFDRYSIQFIRYVKDVSDIIIEARNK